MRISACRSFLTLAVLATPSLCVAQAGSPSSCLLSMSANAPIAMVSRGGRQVSATADSTGYCTFTVTACVNDTSMAGCMPGNVSRLKITGWHDPGVGELAQKLQEQLPTTQQSCAQATVTVGQTLRRRIIGAVKTPDGRGTLHTLALVCECPGAAQAFSSTFDGIQKVIFAQHGCTNPSCHGSDSKQGGLDLSPSVAYQNLVGAASTESELKRVEPGDQNRSFLWLKLAAKTNPAALPSGVEVAGAPMPNNLPAISAGELEALRLWVFSGAPQSGTVGGTETLLNACLAPPAPIVIKPLDPPPQSKGVQFVMPPWKLEAHSEHEICFATYYDVSAQVPPAFQDPSGTMFRFSGQELRQDPQSHHLILNRYIGSADMVHDPSFGAWTCNGGAFAGQPCEPTDLASCGSGTCTSEIRQSFACLGFGPSGDGGPTFYAIGGAQKAQSNLDFIDGVFAQIPMKGVLYWNSHAFNLTDRDTIMHGRLNYYFATNQTYPVRGIFDTTRIFAPNAAPYTTQTVCNDEVLPRGARLFSLSSHTHKHGKHFTVTAPDSTLLYESFVYNDPATVTFDPPLVFDSPDAAQRTLRYCSLYNNGVATDGSPDPTTVTRRSKLPQSAQNSIGLCTPVACAAGKIGARCRGQGDDRSCDSVPGANDGACDACPITGGESTENEMFILIGDYYLDASSSAPANGLRAAADGGAPGRSTSTELALPPQLGCGSSHQGHVHNHP